MTQHTELKPCPFCGGEGIVDEATTGFYACCKSMECEVFVGYNSIYDESWGAFDSEREAITAWNTRA